MLVTTCNMSPQKFTQRVGWKVSAQDLLWVQMSSFGDKNPTGRNDQNPSQTS